MNTKPPPPKTCSEAASRLREAAYKSFFSQTATLLLTQADILDLFGDQELPERALTVLGF